MSESVRTYDTGATRASKEGKFEYEGYLSPLVVQRYAKYMHKHQFQADGRIRTADNWQRGIPKGDYIDSGWRHFMDWWLHHRGYVGKTTEDLEESICALIFNASGYLHELLKEQYQNEGGSTSQTGTQERSDLSDRVSQEPTDSYGRPIPPHMWGFGSIR